MNKNAAVTAMIGFLFRKGWGTGVRFVLLTGGVAGLLTGCSPGRAIGRAANRELLSARDLRTAQVGISVYDPGSGQTLYQYQGDHYFVPASNTKLFTLYAGLRYLGDSLVGMRYRLTDTALFVLPAGDPSFLHPDFSDQPVFDCLKKAARPIYLADDNWQEEALGRGWAWDDYNDDYAAERSSFPVYGNMIRWIQEQSGGNANDPFGNSPSVFSLPEVDWPVRFTTDTAKKNFFVHRARDRNVFEITEGKEKYQQQATPFITDGLLSAASLLKDTVGFPGAVTHLKLSAGPGGLTTDRQRREDWRVLHSRPVDSLFVPMMLHSDNFFAEQTLLMVANERLGLMREETMIDTLLNGELRDLPGKPSWVDGSGLSRYNLFSPRDLVWILDKLQQDFGLERMKRLLPTGGSGTLRNYYQPENGYLFAKTGSLTGVVALSGYLITQKNRLLIFSILINNHRGNGAEIRRDIERFLRKMRAT